MKRGRQREADREAERGRERMREMKKPALTTISLKDPFWRFQILEFLIKTRKQKRPAQRRWSVYVRACVLQQRCRLTVGSVTAVG